MKMLKHLQKTDKSFLLVLLPFLLLMYSRYFDHTLDFHSAPLGIMQNYHFTALIMVIYLLLILGFVVLSMQRIQSSVHRDVYYLSTFLLIFLWSFFLCDGYFGATDVYAWIAVLVCAMLLLCHKAEVLVPFATLAAFLFSPMSICSIGMIFLVMLIYRYAQSGKKRYIGLAIWTILSAAVGLAVAVKLRYFTTDAVPRLTLHKGILAVILLIPYIITAVHLFGKLVGGSSRQMKAAYICYAISGIPAVIVWGVLGDYARMIFYGFSICLILLMFFYNAQDTYVIDCVQQEKQRVKKYCPVPVVFVAYVFLIITFWMVGAEYIDPETILHLKN